MGNIEIGIMKSGLIVVYLGRGSLHLNALCGMSRMVSNLSKDVWYYECKSLSDIVWSKETGVLSLKRNSGHEEDFKVFSRKRNVSRVISVVEPNEIHWGLAAKVAVF